MNEFYLEAIENEPELLLEDNSDSMTAEDNIREDFVPLSSDPLEDLPELQASRTEFPTERMTLSKDEERAMVERFMVENNVKRVPPRPLQSLTPSIRTQVVNGATAYITGPHQVNQVKNQTFKKGRVIPRNQSFLVSLKKHLQGNKVRKSTFGELGGFVGTSDEMLHIWDASLIVEQGVARGFLDEVDLLLLLKE